VDASEFNTGLWIPVCSHLVLLVSDFSALKPLILQLVLWVTNYLHWHGAEALAEPKTSSIAVGTYWWIILFPFYQY
jgi:hypothetical protein